MENKLKESRSKLLPCPFDKAIHCAELYEANEASLFCEECEHFGEWLETIPGEKYKLIKQQSEYLHAIVRDICDVIDRMADDEHKDYATKMFYWHEEAKQLKEKLDEALREGIG